MPKCCLVINLDRCTGCDSCIVSCKMENKLGLGYANNRVEMVGPIGTYPNVSMYYLPVQCQQCENASCLAVCPTGATYRDEATGEIQVNEQACIGCRRCMDACPFGARTMDEDALVVHKCTLCRHLTDDDPNAEPICVHNCPGGARFFGDLEDPESPVSIELSRYNANCVHELTAPNGEAPLTKYILSPRFGQWQQRS